MPLTRKQQILSKIESSDGVNANPGASDADVVYEPQLSREVEIANSIPAGASLSPQVQAVGVKKQTLTFTSDFRGSGDTSIPITAPPWAGKLRACGMHEVTPVRIPVSSIAAGKAFQAGEIVQKSSTIRGMVLACIPTAGSPSTRLAVAGDVIVIPIEGTFTSTGTLTGESSTCTATIGTVADYPGKAYKPTSLKIMNVLATGGWTGGTPTGPGDVIEVRNGSEIVGHVQLIEDVSAGPFDDLNVVVLHGTVADTYTLHFGAGSATVAGAPTLVYSPSMTHRHNLDGRRRDLTGSRGTFVLAGDSGNPMKFAWSFTGSPQSAADALAVATSGLSAIVPPRLFGAQCAFGLGERQVKMPTKRVELDIANTLVDDLDANSPTGIYTTFITSREPKIALTVNDIHSGFDWEAAQESANQVRVAVLLGSTLGNVMGIVAAKCQAKVANPGDAEGVAVVEVELTPTAVIESGDDEFCIFQL